MQRTIIAAGTSLIMLATVSLAQTPPPVPAVAGALATPAEAAATEAAAKAKAVEEKKASDAARKESEQKAKEQERQAEKQREAAEKQAKAQEKAAAEAKKAEAARAAEAAAAAEKAKAAEAAAAASAAAATAAAAAPKGDARDVATQICLAEAKSRATAVGATNVTMNKVEDTDKKSDGRASVRAKVNIVTMVKDKPKVQKKTFKCDTRNGTVTAFKWS